MLHRTDSMLDFFFVLYWVSEFYWICYIILFFVIINGFLHFSPEFYRPTVSFGWLNDVWNSFWMLDYCFVSKFIAFLFGCYQNRMIFFFFLILYISLIVLVTILAPLLFSNQQSFFSFNSRSSNNNLISICHNKCLIKSPFFVSAISLSLLLEFFFFSWIHIFSLQHINWLLRVC